MKPSFFDNLATKRADYIARIDDIEFAPAIRNHLLQLFRAAHIDEPLLTGVKVGMGAAFPTGDYHSLDEDQAPFQCRALEWEQQTRWQPVSDKVRAFFVAVRDYEDLLCNGRSHDLPYINDITLDDIAPKAAKRVTRTKRAS